MLFETPQFSKFESRECVQSRAVYKNTVLLSTGSSSLQKVTEAIMGLALWRILINRTLSSTAGLFKVKKSMLVRSWSTSRHSQWYIMYVYWSHLLSSGWYDPLLQNEAYVTFATDAPGYGQLQSDAVIAALNEAFFGTDGCKVQEQACYDAGNSTASNKICGDADNFCVSFLSLISCYNWLLWFFT